MFQNGHLVQRMQMFNHMFFEYVFIMLNNFSANIKQIW
jgi:hypothetical protein